MGLGTGLGTRGRRGGRARRARRVRHHQRQHHHNHRRHRRHHHGVHTHHRAGVHHHGAHRTFLWGYGMMFGNRRHAGARTTGGTRTSVTVTPSASSNGNTGRCCRAPPWLGPVVISIVLLTLIIVPFAVPSVPIPVGITFLVIFVLVILVPFVSNVIQTRTARRRNAEHDVEAPPAAEEEPTAAEGRPNVAATSVVYDGIPMHVSGSSHGPGEMNGDRSNTGYAYDPPPSFTEATAASPTAPSMADPVNDAPQGPRSDQAGYPATQQLSVATAAEVPSTADEPPPPSYDEAIAGDAAYEP